MRVVAVVMAVVCFWVLPRPVQAQYYRYGGYGYGPAFGYGYGGFGGYGGWGGRAASQYYLTAQGRASLINAESNNQLNAAQVQLLRQQTRTLAMKNNQEQRRINAQLRAEQQKREERFQQLYGPLVQKALSKSAPQSGGSAVGSVAPDAPHRAQLDWPAALRATQFAGDRAAIEQLLASRHSLSGAALDQNQKTLSATLVRLAGDLRKESTTLAPSQYLAARQFVHDLSQRVW